MEDPEEFLERLRGKRTVLNELHRLRNPSEAGHRRVLVLREMLEKQMLTGYAGAAGIMPEFAMPTDIHALFAMLEASRLRYVVVGGLALVLHGVDRLTADVDLAVDLAPEATGRLVETLTKAGYRATAPVDARLLADPRSMSSSCRRSRSTNCSTMLSGLKSPRTS